MFDFLYMLRHNAVVLSHKTLRRFGLPSESLAKLPSTTGIQASGEKHSYRKLGGISLYHNKIIRVCDAEAVCHAVRETHDLIGTEMFRQFCRVNFILANENFMELLK